MKNKIIMLILCFATCLAISSGLKAAAVHIPDLVQDPRTLPIALIGDRSESQIAATITIARAISQNNAAMVKKVFDDPKNYRILAYTKPALAQKLIQMVSETVKTILEADKQLDCLNNDAGKLFASAINKLKTLIKQQLAREDLSPLEMVPEAAAQIIAELLASADLYELAISSRRAYGLFHNELEKKNSSVARWSATPTIKTREVKEYDMVVSIDFSHDGATLAMLVRDIKKTRIYRSVQGRYICLLNLKNNQLRELDGAFYHDKIAFSPVDKNSLISFDRRSQQLTFWDINTSSLAHSFGFNGLINIAALSPCGGYIAAGDCNGNLYLFSSSQKIYDSFPNHMIYSLRDYGYGDNTFALAFNKTCNSIFIAYQPANTEKAITRCCEIDIDTHKVCSEFTIPYLPNELIISPDGATAALNVQDNEIIVWDLKINEAITKISCPVSYRGRRLPIIYSPDGKLLAVGFNNRTIIIWDAQTGMQINQLSLPGGSAIELAFSRDCKKLAAGDSRGRITIFEVGG